MTLLEHCGMASNLNCYQVVGSRSGRSTVRSQVIGDSSVTETCTLPFRWLFCLLSAMSMSLLSVWNSSQGCLFSHHLSFPSGHFLSGGLSAAPSPPWPPSSHHPDQWLLSLFSPFLVSVGIISSQLYLKHFICILNLLPLLILGF